MVSNGASTMGSYVDRLNVVRERVRGEVIAGVRDAANCLMRAISKAKRIFKFWYDALDDVVLLLACFNKSSSRRIRGLWHKGGKFCFLQRTGVQWVEAMFHELDIVLEGLLAILLHRPEYINYEAALGVGRRLRACWHFCTTFSSLLRPCFPMFLHWCVPLAKKVHTTRGAQVDVVRGVMNVICMQRVYRIVQPSSPLTPQ